MNIKQKISQIKPNSFEVSTDLHSALKFWKQNCKSNNKTKILFERMHFKSKSAKRRENDEKAKFLSKLGTIPKRGSTESTN